MMGCEIKLVILNKIVYEVNKLWIILKIVL